MDFVPKYLKPYIFNQHHELYSFEQHSIWRYVMRRLKSFLKDKAHHAYLEGLEKTGITIDEIPKISEIDEKLKAFNWRAVPVSGFIPPQVFMKFQALSILPIARELRTLDHIVYTPAPDIIHEAAGHAPLLIDPSFSDYLKLYGDISQKAIFAKEDLELYKAIRHLSDIKERSDSSKEDIQKAENQLKQARKAQTYISEVARLGRMNWWTAEYGLIGNPPVIFGAGLLSSLHESQHCLTKPKKIPLDINCLDFSYDITKPQPQLFVTPSFEHLKSVLKELENKMSFRIGGKTALLTALKSQTKNTVILETGLEISGELQDIKFDKDSGDAFFLKFQGPCQLSFQEEILPGHDLDYHKDGYSTPLGKFQGELQEGKTTELSYDSGIHVKGFLKKVLSQNNIPLVLTFEKATVTYKEEVLFEPHWGDFDLALGCQVSSVLGAAMKPIGLSHDEYFKPRELPLQTTKDKALDSIFKTIRALRKAKEKTSRFSEQDYQKCVSDYLEKYRNHWLIGLELLELEKDNKDILENLNQLKKQDKYKDLIEEGLKII